MRFLLNKHETLGTVGESYILLICLCVKWPRRGTVMTGFNCYLNTI